MISVTILRMASLKPSSHKLTTRDCSGFEDLVKAIAKAFGKLHNLVRKPRELLYISTKVDRPRYFILWWNIW